MSLTETATAGIAMVISQILMIAFSVTFRSYPSQPVDLKLIDCQYFFFEDSPFLVHDIVHGNNKSICVCIFIVRNCFSEDISSPAVEDLSVRTP